MCLLSCDNALGIVKGVVNDIASDISCGDADHSQKDHGGCSIMDADSALGIAYEPRNKINVFRRIFRIPVIRVKLAYKFCYPSDFFDIGHLGISVVYVQVPVGKSAALDKCALGAIRNPETRSVNIGVQILLRIYVARLYRQRRSSENGLVLVRIVERIYVGIFC